MPRKKEPLSREEQEKIRAARAALREESELAALEDQETERAIKAGEIPDPDGDESLMDDDDTGGFEDDDGDDETDTDAEGLDEEEHESDGSGDADDDDGGASEGGSTEKDAPRRRKDRPSGDGEAELASAGGKPAQSPEIDALGDADLAAMHLTVVGREPHPKAERATIIRNIKKAQAQKKG